MLSFTAVFFLSVLSVSIVGINIVVCSTIVFKRKLRTYTNGFIVSISLSDLLFGAVFLPVFISHPFHQMNGYVTAICLFSNVGNLCSLTTERAIALLQPLRYRDLIGRYFVIMILMAWIIPILVSVLPYAWEDQNNVLVQNVYVVCLITMFIIVPYLYIIISYSLIFRAVKKRKNCLPSVHYNKTKYISTVEFRVARLFFFVSLLFAIVWVPSVYMTICFMVNRQDLVPSDLELVSVGLFGLNSVFNSLLYAFMKPDLKKELRLCLAKCLVTLGLRERQYRPSSVDQAMFITRKSPLPPRRARTDVTESAREVSSLHSSSQNNCHVRKASSETDPVISSCPEAYVMFDELRETRL